MGNRAKVTVGYGICYPFESADAAKFSSADFKVGAGESNPTSLACRGDFGEGVEVASYGHYDSPGYLLAIGGLVERGRSWEPLLLSAPPPLWVKDRADAVLKQYCAKYGLTWSEPQWWAVPYYG